MKLIGLAVLTLVVTAAAPSFAQSEQQVAKSRRANEAMAAGRFGEAITLYRELVGALPNHPGLVLNLGLALHMAGQDREAIQHFKTVLKLDPSHLPARLFLGASYLGLGEPAQAVEPLQRVVRVQPENQEAREMLADALFWLERFEQAAEHLRPLAKTDPQNPKVWYTLGRCYRALSRRAVEELERVGPESAYALALLADSRAQQQQQSNAFSLYRKALARLPNMRGVHTALAGIYRNTGHPDWAAIEEDKEKLIPPPDCGSQKQECDFVAGRYQDVVTASVRKTSESYYWQARAYDELARESFSRLEQLPPSAEMHEFRAETHRDLGRPLEAVKEWREALKLSPGNPLLPRELATSLCLAGDYRAALALVEPLLQRQPNSADLHFLYGDTLLKLQQAEKAIPYLKTAVKQDPKLLSAHASLGLAYLQLGESAQAISALKLALPTDEDGSLHYQLARAYQSTGQGELARQTLAKYQDILKSGRTRNRESEEESQITPP